MRVAVVCASNMNRSMEAHRVFAAAALDVSSFGVGQHVKLPGASQRTPNVYEFGTPYRAIYEDLRAKDADLCVSRGGEGRRFCSLSTRLSQVHTQRAAADARAQHGAQAVAGAVAAERVCEPCASRRSRLTTRSSRFEARTSTLSSPSKSACSTPCCSTCRTAGGARFAPSSS